MRFRRRRPQTPLQSCGEVAALLQSYLDAEIDNLSAHRVGEHLELCRRCGLEAETDEAIKTPSPGGRSRWTAIYCRGCAASVTTLVELDDTGSA